MGARKPARMRAVSARSGPAASLVERLLRGDQAALSRALSLVTNESEGSEEIVKACFAHHGRTHKIGFCGAPGSGKSSLINRLVSGLRREGRTVAVLAVDPTSPFTGGAFLGDRLRVQEHALDSGVFLRSLATRGMMGGLNATIFGAIRVLEAAGAEGGQGFDRILIETVGTGQDEVDIADAADTIVCVTAPHQGDEFQAMKAGTMEIADVFAVNKADLEEVDKTVAALRDALSLGPGAGKGGWTPRVSAVSAATGQGLPELLGLLEEHRAFLESSDEGRRRRRQQVRRELSLWLSRRIYREAVHRIREEHIEQLLARKTDPVSLGRKLLSAPGGPIGPKGGRMRNGPAGRAA